MRAGTNEQFFFADHAGKVSLFIIKRVRHAHRIEDTLEAKLRRHLELRQVHAEFLLVKRR